MEKVPCGEEHKLWIRRLRVLSLVLLLLGEKILKKTFGPVMCSAQVRSSWELIIRPWSSILCV